jgi:transcriptional regulator of arginine metabolism
MKEATAGSERARKRHRQQTLLRLVGERDLGTQEELVRALRGAGFRATQATVSRDIVELGLVKVPRDGAHVYAPPVASSGGGADRLRRFCEDYPVQAAVAGTIVVLRSLPGTANALAAAIDAARVPHAVGTLAGDDTVFIAVARERETRGVVERLKAFGVMEGAAR